MGGRPVSVSASRLSAYPRARALKETLKRHMTPHIFNPIALGNKLTQFRLLSQILLCAGTCPKRRPWASKADFHALVRRYGRVYVKNTEKGRRCVFGPAKKPRRLACALARQRPGPTVPGRYRRRFRLPAAHADGHRQSRAAVEAGPVAGAAARGPGANRGRPFDVRVNVQKDGLGSWLIAGHVVRIASSQHSAVTRRGDYRSVEPVLKQVWPGRVQSVIRKWTRSVWKRVGASKKRWA